MHYENIDKRGKDWLELYPFSTLYQSIRCVIEYFAILILKKNKDMIFSYSKLDDVAEITKIFVTRKSEAADFDPYLHVDTADIRDSLKSKAV